MVKLIHPDLPDVVIDVPAKGIPARAKHGWRRQDDGPPAKSAPKADWVAYARSQGDEDLDVSKQTLIDRHHPSDQE